ncbi:MAG: RdgB/HAM1 family non-canonical purine NTP pyrophosphatase [Thiotrichaceae bacterium]|nr:RdgB/HAM1 family non-canonical purine NTP pyrophosphatase [Thiotrichaceae bacterium]
MKKIVLATGNAGKVREFAQLLAEFDAEIIPQTQLNVSNVPETGLTFVENALIKARHAAEITGLPAIADDSGIEVDALNGAPGIYSARFAGENATDFDNNQLLLQQLQTTPEAERTARYHCVIVYLRHALDPTPLICHGIWEGRVLTAPQGDNGFGYDPLFLIPEHQCTAAQMPSELKNKLSHRGQAMRELQAALQARAL